MSRPIAIYYHAYLRDGSERSWNIVYEQLSALEQSGLAAAAREIHIGCGRSHQLEIAMLCPGNAVIHPLPEPICAELPTMRIMIERLQPGWNILYHHTKGASYPNDRGSGARRQLQNVCVLDWRKCVDALNQGFETAGDMWYEPVKAGTYPPGQRYWVGNFWWAVSDYLLTLAPLVEPQFASRTELENRYEAEVWIGKSPHKPKTFRRTTG